MSIIPYFPTGFQLWFLVSNTDSLYVEFLFLAVLCMAFVQFWHLYCDTIVWPKQPKKLKFYIQRLSVEQWSLNVESDTLRGCTAVEIQN